MKTNISLVVILFALLSVEANAQILNCPGPSSGSSSPSTLGVSSAPSLRSSGSSFGSNFGGDVMSYSDVSMFNSAARSLAENNYTDIKGSPFLSEEFIEGTLITTEGMVITDVPMKYNIHTQEFVAKSHMDTDILLDERQYQEIILPFEGKDLSFQRTNSEKPNAFYEVLFESAELTFIKEHYITVKEASSNGITSTDKQFSQRERYYVMQGNGGLAQKTRLKKKNLLALLPSDMAKDLKDYAAANNIRLLNESDFIELFTGVYDHTRLADKQ